MSYKIRTTAVFDLEMQSVIDTLFDASMQFIATLVNACTSFLFSEGPKKVLSHKEKKELKKKKKMDEGL